MSENPNQLDEIFKIIHDATQDKKQASKSLAPKWISVIERYSLALLVATMCILVVIAILSKVFSVTGLPLKLSVLTVYLLVVVSGLTYMLSTISGIVVETVRHRRMFGQHGLIMNRIRLYIQEDHQDVLRLKAYPKHMLEYVLMQYQTTWTIMDGRTALLIGDFKKLGLLPALAAAAVAASKLLKDDANFMLWIPIAMLSAMYVFAFVAMASRERVSYVISLLSHAISQSTNDAAPGDEDKKS